MLIGDTSNPQKFQNFCQILGNNEKSIDTDIYSQRAKIIAYGGPKINFPKGTNF